MDSFWPPTDFRLSGDLLDENLLRLKFSLLLPPKAQTGSLKKINKINYQITNKIGRVKTKSYTFKSWDLKG